MLPVPVWRLRGGICSQHRALVRTELGGGRHGLGFFNPTPLPKGHPALCLFGTWCDRPLPSILRQTRLQCAWGQSECWTWVPRVLCCPGTWPAAHSQGPQGCCLGRDAELASGKGRVLAAVQGGFFKGQKLILAHMTHVRHSPVDRDVQGTGHSEVHSRPHGQDCKQGVEG